MGVTRVTWPTFQILGPPNISGTAEAINLKFCMQIDVRACQTKNVKIGKSGRGLGHVTYFSNFGTLLISLEPLRVETWNFARRLMLGHTKHKCKTWSKWGVARVTWPTFKFWDPVISQERLKIESSNFACRLTVRILNRKIAKMQKRGVARVMWPTLMGYVTYFQILGPPNLWNGWR